MKILVHILKIMQNTKGLEAIASRQTIMALNASIETAGVVAEANHISDSTAKMNNT